MKKFLSLILMFSLIGVIAGCSSDNKSEDNNTSDKAVETSSTGEIKMGRVNYAAHGDKSFAVAVVAMDGDKIVGASMDEFQFLSAEEDGVVPVPNSDGAFGENYKDAKTPLASKVDSNKYYSAHMAEKAGATNTVIENYTAIEKYVTGKTVAELEEVLSSTSPEEMVDVVSGATLVDTYGYVSAFVEAAKAAK